MIIVDRALQQREHDKNPVRVAMVGAGFMGRGIALQILNSVPGLRLVAISNRHLEAAKKVYAEAGAKCVKTVDSVSQLEQAVAREEYAVTDDPVILCETKGIDAILEVTGSIEFAANVVLKAIENRKHTIIMNAELDGTIGCILKVYADRAGVVLTNTDGDQPGVLMNLYRFVKGLGVRPVLCGNIKGLHDPYRNPTTQQEFARKWQQTASMVTSFADGTKISYEQAIVANATAMRVAKRGMLGPTVSFGTPIQEAVNWYPQEALTEGDGIVDYVVGAMPNPGVFVLGTHDHPTQQHYLNLYKLGAGPLYCFYTPYHLCHFEVPNTIARAVLFHDAAISPLDAPRVEVVATAKTDLKAGQVIDGIGYYMTYGQCENADVARKQTLLPMGLAEGCRLKNNIRKDQVLTYDDVYVPDGRLCDKLRAEQDRYFAQAPHNARSASREKLLIEQPELVGREHEYLFDLLKDSVMTRTVDGRINFWNRRAEELYGWRKEEAIGKVSHSLLQTQFPEPLEQIEAELVQTGRWEGKLVHATRDGRRVVVASRWILDLKEQPGAVVEINTRSADF